MIITAHKVDNTDATAHNDDSNLHNDEVGENTGEDTALAKAAHEDKEKQDSTPKKENL